MLTHNGATMCMSAWAERVGITTSCLYRRLKNGWPVQLALETPAAKRIFLKDLLPKEEA
jgi:hypothetical protein